MFFLGSLPCTLRPCSSGTLTNTSCRTTQSILSCWPAQTCTGSSSSPLTSSSIFSSCAGPARRSPRASDVAGLDTPLQFVLCGPCHPKDGLSTVCFVAPESVQWTFHEKHTQVCHECFYIKHLPRFTLRRVFVNEAPSSDSFQCAPSAKSSPSNILAESSSCFPSTQSVLGRESQHRRKRCIPRRLFLVKRLRS